MRMSSLLTVETTALFETAKLWTRSEVLCIRLLCPIRLVYTLCLFAHALTEFPLTTLCEMENSRLRMWDFTEDATGHGHTKNWSSRS